MKGLRFRIRLGAVVVLATTLLTAGCASENVIGETVASVDGNSISVMEVREAIGIPGGIVSASMIPVEQKKKALEQIVESRLLAQEARSMGLDNTTEFRDAFRAAERGIFVKGLFRRELEAKGKKAESEIESAAKELMSKDKTLKPDDAKLRAGQTVISEKLGKIQEEVLAAARKAFPEKIDASMLSRIAKGETVPDAAVLGQAGEEKVTYAEAKTLVKNATGASQHPGKDFTKDENALKSVVGQELTNRSLYAYAKQQGVEKGRWMDLDRQLLERSVLVELLAEKVIFKGIVISDKDIETTYAEHKEMFNKDGKEVPLSEVRGQIVEFLRNDRRRKAVEAYLVPLKAKAKISVVESALPKV